MQRYMLVTFQENIAYDFVGWRKTTSVLKFSNTQMKKHFLVVKLVFW